MKCYLISSLLIFQSMLFGLSTGPFVTISTPGNNSSPQVAVAESGNAVAIWRDISNQIFAAYFNESTGIWSAPIVVSIGTVPRVGIDEVGNAIAVWVTTSDIVNQINASRFNPTTMTWSAPVLISTTGGINAFPQISMNSAGVALIVWTQSSPSRVPTQSNPSQVLASSFDPTSSTFSSPPTIFLRNTNPASFEIDDINTGIAVWQSFPSGAIQAARLFVP